MRLTQQTLAVILAPWLLVTATYGQDKKDAGPLEMRVFARRTTYPFVQGGDKFCFVAIDVELKNVGKEKLQLILAPEPTLELTGPRPEAVRKTGGHTFYVPQEEQRTLDPGKTQRVTLRTLTYRVSTGQYNIVWLEPGDFILKAVYTIAVSPRPAGSVPGRLDGRAENKIAADDKFGIVILKSEPINLTMRAGSVVDYWADALKDDDMELRRIALINLRDLGVQAQHVANLLVGLLTDRDPDIRLKTIQALEAFGPKVKSTVLPGFLQSLKDNDKAVRLAAIKALSHLATEDKTIAPDLLPFLRDADKDLRLAAAQAMLVMGSRVEPRDTAALLSALKAENVEEVRCRIIQALYNHPQLEVLQALLPYLQAGDKHTRYAAFHTVGHLAVFTKRDAQKEEQLGQPFKQAVVELIEAMKDHEALPYAIHALRQFRADAAPAVPALLMALDDPRNQHKDSIHHPRVWIVQAFRDIGPGAKAATRALAMRLLTDPDWSVRQYAAQALSSIGADPREAGPALNQALKDKMVQVRNEAAPALAKIGAIDELLDGLNDDHAETRSSVIQALGTLKDHAKRIVPALVKVLRADTDAKNRRNAAYALGSLGSADGVPALGQALKDADADVRAGAVESLRTLGRAARDAVPMLFELVKTDKTEKNREKACWALVAIDIQGQKSFVPALVEMLSDKNPAVTYPAIYLLGQLGPDAREARDRLRAIAANQKGHPADAAREALRKIEASR